MLDNFGNVLVSGGLGFIGRHLTDALYSLGKEVSVLDSSRTAVTHPVPSGVKVYLADIRDPSAVAKAAEGADLVFHAAANANGTLSVIQPRLDFELNAIGTFSFAEALLNSGIRKLVYLSSASVYGKPQRFPMSEDHPTRPFIPYGASKLCGEHVCMALHHACGLPVVAARPFCAYGPGENPGTSMVEVSRFLRWHLNELPIQVVGDIDRKTRDFVHVRDLIAGLMVLADRGQEGEVYNIGSGIETSMRQLVEMIGAATGRDPSFNARSDIEDDTYRLVADISKIEALGYRPVMSLRDGVQELAADLGERPELPGTQTIFARGQHAEF